MQGLQTVDIFNMLLIDLKDSFQMHNMDNLSSVKKWGINDEIYQINWWASEMLKINILVSQEEGGAAKVLRCHMPTR